MEGHVGMLKIGRYIERIFIEVPLHKVDNKKVIKSYKRPKLYVIACL